MHDLAFNENGAQFAYRHQGGLPWHGHGHSMDGHSTAAEMLEVTGADYTVELFPANVIHPITGEPVECPDRFITGRVNADESVDTWEPVKGRYTVIQNTEVLDRALAVVGASGGDAVLETLGVLNAGRKFFAAIDLGTVIVDPMGVNDKVMRYLLVFNSHDGSSPVIFANTDVRAVCANTVRLGLNAAQSIFKARHTPNFEKRAEEAGEVLGISADWSKTFVQEAERLLAIPVTSGRIDRVLDKVWPKADADTDRKMDNRDFKVTAVRSLYANERNAGGYGENGWSLLQAITEWADHERGGSLAARSQASFELDNMVHRLKKDAHNAIVALAN